MDAMSERGEADTPEGAAVAAAPAKPDARESMVGKPLDDPLLTLAGKNVAVSLAVLSGVFVVVRLFAVAGWDKDTALALLASAGVANVLLGTAIVLIPAVAPIIAITLLDTGNAYYRVGRRALITVFLGDMCLIASVIVSPAILLLLLAILVGSRLALPRLPWFRGRPPRKRRSEDAVAYVVVLLAAYVPLVIMTGSPWLPREVIATGSTTTVGYVTSSDGQWTHVLVDHPRAVVVLDTASITVRSTCRARPDLLTATIGELFVPRTAPAPCP
jgi:hypothetical protein